MKQSVYKRLLHYLKPYGGSFAGAILSAVASISLTLYAPVLTGRAIDQIIGPGEVYFGAVLKILSAIAVTAAGSAVFQWLMAFFTNRLCYRTVRDLRQTAFHNLSCVPLKYIDGHSHGDIISRLANDLEQVSDGLLQALTQLFTGVVTIVGTLLFMLSVNWQITVVVAVITPLSLFVAAFIAKLSRKMFVEQAAVQGELSGCVEELLGNQKIVKTFRYESRAQEKFDEINTRLYKCGVNAQFYSSLTNPSTRFVNGLVYAAVGVAGALSAVTGTLTVGQISCFLSYANQYTKPFNEISGVVTQLQTATAALRRVYEVIDEPEEQPDAPGAVAMETCKGCEQLRDVYFSYHPDVPLIEDFSLHVNPGERVAIVGPTGCGKTTVINLLMRFYDVTSGSIAVDGTDIRDITRDSLRGLYGMVLQETWLYSGTVRENIAYGRPDAAEEEIIEAAKAAHAHQFIMQMPKGYDTVISENGGNISQGQKQLLCIARVMLTHPPMLILDEATSNIDTRTELKIQSAFAKMMQGKTSFIVAHRLSTIQEADVILVMNRGHIVEQGNHRELLEQGGFYANLYNSQFDEAEKQQIG